MSNKGYYNKEESFIEKAELKEEAPIEVAPEVTEEIKEKIPEIRKKESKPTPQVKVEPKKQAKVILITRDGCIAQTIDGTKTNISFYGAQYLAKQLGDIIEF